MYRIELSPGEETAFRSIEELAVAIRRKVVTSRARIYHNATAKWLPIQFHPHYKLALSMPLSQADLVAGPRAAPLSTLNLGEPQSAPASPAPSNRESATQAALAAWPEPKPSAPSTTPSPAPEVPRQTAPAQPPIMLGTPAPEPRRAAEPRHTPAPPRPVEPRRPPEPRRVAEPARMSAPARSPEPQRRAEPKPAPEPQRRSRRSGKRKAKRTFRVALAGAVLIACAHLAISSVSSSNGELAQHPRTPRKLIQVPSDALKDITPRTVAAVMPVLQSIPVPGLRSATAAAVGMTMPPASRTVAPQPKPTAPAAPGVVDSAAGAVPLPPLEAAPDAGEISTGVPLPAESLTAQAVDSSGKKALKRILRTIGGTSTPEGKPRKP